MQCSDDGEISVEIGKSPELRTLNVRRLRRLVSQDVAMEQPVNGELERREVERYKKFSDSKLRNVRAAVSKWPYETYEARLARKELIRRGEWVDSPLENDYGDAGEELVKRGAWYSFNQNENAAEVATVALVSAFVHVCCLSVPRSKTRRGRRSQAAVDRRGTHPTCS